jgi:hypothetical protein
MRQWGDTVRSAFGWRTSEASWVAPAFRSPVLSNSHVYLHSCVKVKLAIKAHVKLSLNLTTLMAS